MALIMIIAYKRFTWKAFKASLLDTSKGSHGADACRGCQLFHRHLIGCGGDDMVRNLLFSLGSGNKWIIFFIMMLIVFILGMFIDWIGIAMICLPIFVPIAIELGFDPLWF